MRVLVTGGTGYIGGHVVRLLRGRGDHVVVLDDVLTGIAERIGDTPLIRVDLAGDSAVDVITTALVEHRIDSVIHLAARKQVGESVSRAAWYYSQNIGSLASVLQAMEPAGVQRVVISSSAAVYAPSESPIAETGVTLPASPYGETKLAGEWLAHAASVAGGLRAASLRYFNVAGTGWPELGDTAVLNLVPMVLQCLDNDQSPIIFGGDYDTPDGTCIRDYVHVLDLAEAHLAALDGLDRLPPGHRVFNVGTGVGASVREMVGAILQRSGSSRLAEVQGRRVGDAAFVVAAVDRIRDELGWSARFGLDDIVSSAWESHAHFARV